MFLMLLIWFQTFEEEEEEEDEDYLTRDEFNLHKMVVAVSQAGKVSVTQKCLLPEYCAPLPEYCVPSWYTLTTSISDVAVAYACTQ